jgi:hypothetical protein
METYFTNRGGINMNFATSTGKTIQQAFDEYHKNNPKVYEKFKELSLLAIRKGKSKISFKLILNVIRWEHFMNVNEQTDVFLDNEWRKFKINDVYASHYARLFIQEFPEHHDKIETRKLRAS